jgi:hypothetical protein
VQLKYLKNVTLESNQDYDVIVVGLNSESRATNIVSKFHPLGRLKGYLQEGQADDGFAFSDNEKILKTAGYSICRSNNLYDLIKALPEKGQTKPLSVLLDISCLYRPTFAEIFIALLKSIDYHDLEITIAYSLAQFTAPVTDEYSNEAIEPVHDSFSGWPSVHSNPTSLIIGLGYERHKAEGASEYLDAGEQWGFIPSSQVKEFLYEVEVNNQNLISRLRHKGHLIRYDVHNAERTFGQLEHVLSELLRTTNPILLPFGPKIFFSLCLLHGVLHPEVGVWHVTGEKNEAPQDRKPSGMEIAFQVRLSNRDK